MTKKALILQPFGIGDCIFSQTIAHRFIEAGYEVVWPVLSHFLDGLERAYPQITWCDVAHYQKYMNIQQDIEVDGYLIVPMRWCVEIMKVSYAQCMAAKYSMYDMDWRGWKEKGMWERNHAKEGYLFERLGLTNEDVFKYRVINNIYGSDSKMKIDIQVPDDGLRSIYMSTIEDYSLFDWSLVLKFAFDIHVVSSSILYMIELLDLKQPIHLYPRPTDPDFDQVKYLFTKPYILH